uniref:Spore protein YkvP/CgeB glycosyl transferase-like domain-containing protein n=1 Tax=candidate division WWE3 bacterium TaxID=2053526 RepID=A0A7C4XV07_UNCKA
MKILYHINSLETVYAARFIYEGYKTAFKEMGHEFFTYTASDDLEKTLEEVNPDMMITSLNWYNLKYLDLDLIKKYRNRGMVLFMQLTSWQVISTQLGGLGLKNDPVLVKLIKDGSAGDVFFHWIEKDGYNMEGFTEETGCTFHTILLAADTSRFYPDYDSNYISDISYVGSYIPEKRKIMRERLFPLMKKYNTKVYGSDWNVVDRVIGFVQKVGQYFNLPVLKGLRRLSLSLEAERKVYSSSTISLNIHEEHQRRNGMDFNERTFKIIASGGFEICDNVAALRRYFNEEELVIAENTKDWFEKIDYFVRNPEKRIKIIEAGRKKVLAEHTYKNRVAQFIDIYKKHKGLV